MYEKLEQMNIPPFKFDSKIIKWMFKNVRTSCFFRRLIELVQWSFYLKINSPGKLRGFSSEQTKIFLYRDALLG